MAVAIGEPNACHLSCIFFPDNYINLPFPRPLLQLVVLCLSLSFVATHHFSGFARKMWDQLLSVNYLSLSLWHLHRHAGKCAMQKNKLEIVLMWVDVRSGEQGKHSRMISATTEERNKRIFRRNRVTMFFYPASQTGYHKAKYQHDKSSGIQAKDLVADKDERFF